MKKKMVIVTQNDVKDCGPCCLLSLIKYYDGYVPIEKIREDTNVSNQGTTVYNLVKALKSYGFDATAKKYKYLSENTIPLIVHIHYENGLDHFMVLYEIKENKVVLMDPAKGKKVLEIDDFHKIFTGVVIESYPRNKIVTMQKGINLFELFIKLISTNKGLCIKIFLCSTLCTFFSIITGMYFKICYNFILENKYINNLLFTIYLFFGIYILKVLLDYFKNYYKNHLDKNIDVNVFKSFISHIFNLPLKVINSHSSGEIISRIMEISNIKETFSDILITGVLDMFLIISSLIVLFLINSKLAFILTFILLIYICISILTNKRIYKKIKDNIEYETDFNASVVENVNMISSITNLNKIDYALSKIENKLVALLYDNFKFKNEYNFYEVIKNSITEIGIFIINTYGFYLIYQNKLNIIDLVTFNTIMVYFIEPVKNIIMLLPKFNYLKASFNKICDLINIEEVNNKEGNIFQNGDIKIENLSFSYNDFDKIIDNLNLTIGLGEKVILKGRSGTGKSTLCEILCGRYKNYEGKISIGNKNLLDLNTSKNITYIGQREALYTDTIKNNILLDNNEESFEKICNICLIDKIVDKKKFRYDFGIDNNFINISGGEKQRIVLARSLMNCKDILIMDEALSELDYHLEKKIIKNIIREFPEKTLIYVSHKFQDKEFERVININE